MARTQAADYDEKQASITAHAAKLFARYGFGGASISELASSCGVSKSLIYHYYSSKEQILYAVMIEHMTALIEVLDTDHYKGLTPDETLREFARRLLRRYVGEADSQRVLLYELDYLPEGQRAEIKGMQRQLIDFAELQLARVNPASTEQRAALRSRVMLFFGMLNWTHTWLKPGGVIDRDTIADLASGITIDAVRKS
ncbi:MAG: TetR/AcrR family transcriptional regulator [Pseudomonadota bacterium]